MARILVGLLFAISCGEPAVFEMIEFEGQRTEKMFTTMKDDVLINPRRLERGSRRQLSWFFPCADDFSVLEGTADFVGEGVHYTQMGGVSTLELNVAGVLCAYRSLPRDVVFAIDVSASMMDNDPLINGSCQRFRAMDKMVEHLAGYGDSRVGLVIYDSSVKVWHHELLPAQEFRDLFINRTYEMKRFLCYTGFNTNYRNALLATEELLKTGQDNSFKEVYFFSDGEPHDLAHDPAGLDVARRIRQTAIIATIGLGQIGILKEDIASKVNGEPLHRQIEDLDELLPLLHELVETENTGAELIYSYLGAENAYHINIWESARFLDAYRFQLDSLVLEVDREDREKNKGVSIDIKYYNNHGNSYRARSELHFVYD